MKTTFLSVLFAVLSFTAQGASLEFKFDINSSAPSIYACDAGIKHATHGKRICYDRTTAESCDPRNCAEGVDCNCVCTGEQGSSAGEYRHDFMKAKHANWKDNGETTTHKVSIAKAAKTHQFNRIFTKKNEWDRQITDLSFNLGSERYGAEFYVDICYRGPQIEYFQAGSFQDTPNFGLKAQATVTDIVSNNGLRYSKLADLQVKAVAVCDQQGKGAYVYAGNSNFEYDNAQLHEINNNMTIPSGQFSHQTNFSEFNTGANLYLMNRFINVGNTFSPRFCKVRYYFKENRRNDSNLLAQLRKWKHHKARVCTYTSINEDVIE